METERRKFSRFLVQDTAFTSLRSDFTKVEKIKDIRSDGLAFQYFGYEGQQIAIVFDVIEGAELCLRKTDSTWRKRQSAKCFGQPYVLSTYCSQNYKDLF